MSNPITNTFAWTDMHEANACVRLNRVSEVLWLRKYFELVTRLGNGVFWYSLLPAIWITQGHSALLALAQVSATAVTGVLLYKLCKLTLRRERPFVTHREIACIGTPLDRGSFPSGHTIHATNFTIMLGTLFPALLWMLIPLSISIALSRIVLGHHYPSDVLAGAVIGAGLASLSLSLPTGIY